MILDSISRFLKSKPDLVGQEAGLLPEKLDNSREILPSLQAERKNYGVESYVDTSETRWLKEWILCKIETLQHSSQTKLRTLDIGGASGYWAMQMARRGVDVTVLDFNGHDSQDIISERNSRLAAQGNDKGQINLYQADIRAASSENLIASCKGNHPGIVTAFNLIHFLTKSEVQNMFHLLANSAAQDSILALSYTTYGNTRNLLGDLILHSPSFIAQALEQEGFNLVYEDMDPRRAAMHQAFRRGNIRENKL